MPIAAGAIDDRQPASCRVQPQFGRHVGLVQRKQSVLSHRGRGIFRRTEANVIAIEIAAGRIRRRECTEISVHSRWIAGVGRVVLRDRLHRPFDRVAAGVLHGGVKTDARRVGVQADRAQVLNPGPRIGRAGELYFAVLPFRNLSKGVRPSSSTSEPPAQCCSSSLPSGKSQSLSPP